MRALLDCNRFCLDWYLLRFGSLVMSGGDFLAYLAITAWALFWPIFFIYLGC